MFKDVKDGRSLISRFILASQLLGQGSIELAKRSKTGISAREGQPPMTERLAVIHATSESIPSAGTSVNQTAPGHAMTSHAA